MSAIATITEMISLIMISPYVLTVVRVSIIAIHDAANDRDWHQAGCGIVAVERSCLAVFRAAPLRVQVDVTFGGGGCDLWRRVTLAA